MKTQLCIQKAQLNQYGGMCKLQLGPFNLSLAMFPFPFYPQQGTAPSDALFPGNRPSPPPLVTPVSALSLPALWPLLLLGFTVAVCFSSAGRGLCSAKMSNVKGVQAWVRDPAHTLWHFQMAWNGWRGVKWKNREKKKKNTFPEEKGWTWRGVKCASDL